jgi:hypothetical protein
MAPFAAWVTILKTNAWVDVSLRFQAKKSHLIGGKSATKTLHSISGAEL